MTARQTPRTAKSSQPTTGSTAPTPGTGPQTPRSGRKIAGPSKSGSDSQIQQPEIHPEHPTPPKEVVVLGKRSVHKSEVKPLREFGHALALRGNQLVTNNTPGAATEVAAGFAEGGGTVKWLSPGEGPGDRPVIIFTNSKMQQDLDRDKPGWRDRGWLIINNPKETAEAANAARIIAKERGTPLPE